MTNLIRISILALDYVRRVELGEEAYPQQVTNVWVTLIDLDRWHHNLVIPKDQISWLHTSSSLILRNPVIHKNIHQMYNSCSYSNCSGRFYYRLRSFVLHVILLLSLRTTPHLVWPTRPFSVILTILRNASFHNPATEEVWVYLCEARLIPRLIIIIIDCPPVFGFPQLTSRQLMNRPFWC